MRRGHARIRANDAATGAGSDAVPPAIAEEDERSGGGRSGGGQCISDSRF